MSKSVKSTHATHISRTSKDGIVVGDTHFVQANTDDDAIQQGHDFAVSERLRTGQKVECTGVTSLANLERYPSSV